MAEEIDALYSNGTWELVALPPSKSPVGCRWVYTVKAGLDGLVDRLKARLASKGYIIASHGQNCLCSLDSFYCYYELIAPFSIRY